MSNQIQGNNNHDFVTLSPSYNLPLLIIFCGLILLISPVHPWPTIIISSFGLFLLLQSFTLRLKITNNELIVLQLGRELRRFPFQHWISWRILTPKLPGLLYFREEASPHLLPMLFDPKALASQLRSKVGDLEVKESIPNTQQND